MNAEGTEQTNLTNNAAVDQRSPWSPDGTRIAFLSTRDGNEEIHSMNPDGTDPVNLSNSATSEALGEWQRLDPPEPEPPVKPSEPPVKPSNDFTFGKAKVNKRKGTAKLFVNVPGSGVLELGGRKLKPMTQATTGGTAKLMIKPKGRARKALKRKGKVKVQATVTFTPTGGDANSQPKMIRLKRKAR